MTKIRKPDPVEGDEYDEDWFNEVDPSQSGEYWRPGRRTDRPLLSDEEPDEE